MTLVKTPASGAVDGLEAVVGEFLSEPSTPRRRRSLWLWLRCAWRRSTAPRPFADLGEARRHARERALARTLVRHDPTRPRF